MTSACMVVAHALGWVASRSGFRSFTEVYERSEVTSAEGENQVVGWELPNLRIFVARGAAWETDNRDEKFAEFAARFGEMRRGGRERGQGRV